MKKNVGKLDRRLRLILALLLFPLLFLKSSPFKWIGLVSIPLLSTALTQRCGVYTVLDMDTLGKE